MAGMRGLLLSDGSLVVAMLGGGFLAFCLTPPVFRSELYDMRLAIAGGFIGMLASWGIWAFMRAKAN